MQKPSRSYWELIRVTDERKHGYVLGLYKCGVCKKTVKLLAVSRVERLETCECKPCAQKRRQRKLYELTFTDGKTLKVTNLAEFSRVKGLNAYTLRQLLRKERKSAYQGIKSVKRISTDKLVK